MLRAATVTIHPRVAVGIRCVMRAVLSLLSELLGLVIGREDSRRAMHWQTPRSGTRPAWRAMQRGEDAGGSRTGRRQIRRAAL